jgi:hypothetical protein
MTQYDNSKGAIDASAEANRSLCVPALVQATGRCSCLPGSVDSLRGISLFDSIQFKSIHKLWWEFRLDYAVDQQFSFVAGRIGSHGFIHSLHLGHYVHKFT